VSGIQYEQYSSKRSAFEAGFAAGQAKANEERERAERKAAAETGDGQPELMTLDAIRAGRYSHDELVARKDEVDALLAGGEGA
jgi:hypothetical protein